MPLKTALPLKAALPLPLPRARSLCNKWLQSKAYLVAAMPLYMRRKRWSSRMHIILSCRQNCCARGLRRLAIPYAIYHRKPSQGNRRKHKCIALKLFDLPAYKRRPCRGYKVRGVLSNGDPAPSKGGPLLYSFFLIGSNLILNAQSTFEWRRL